MFTENSQTQMKNLSSNIKRYLGHQKEYYVVIPDSSTDRQEQKNKNECKVNSQERNRKDDKHLSTTFSEILKSLFSQASLNMELSLSDQTYYSLKPNNSIQIIKSNTLLVQQPLRIKNDEQMARINLQNQQKEKALVAQSNNNQNICQAQFKSQTQFFHQINRQERQQLLNNNSLNANYYQNQCIYEDHIDYSSYNDNHTQQYEKQLKLRKIEKKRKLKDIQNIDIPNQLAIQNNCQITQKSSSIIAEKDNNNSIINKNKQYISGMNQKIDILTEKVQQISLKNDIFQNIISQNQKISQMVNQINMNIKQLQQSIYNISTNNHHQQHHKHNQWLEYLSTQKNKQILRYITWYSLKLQKQILSSKNIQQPNKILVTQISIYVQKLKISNQRKLQIMEQWASYIQSRNTSIRKMQ